MTAPIALDHLASGASPRDIVAYRGSVQLTSDWWRVRWRVELLAPNVNVSALHNYRTYLIRGPPCQRARIRDWARNREGLVHP